ncbi:MAG: NAD-dependent epimerase/dehydratase family protein, partial [Anaerolineales bacterium]|nr:NAD-dependent epimerase/dehydratase family protein [Anaerolineales bacterium]
PGQEVFRVNALGTYNVFEAASRLGIGRVVQASSINAFGCYYSTQHTAPNYLPIDEAHPTYTTDPYSFSKGVVEDIGDYYWRRDGISSVALRLPGVWSPSYVADPVRLQRLRADRAALDRFASQPQDVWRARLANAQQWASEFRRGRPFEYGISQDRTPPRLAADDETLYRMVTHDRFDLWTAIDERDAAQSVVRGLEAAYQGSHVLFVNDCYNLLGYDARTLARLFYPETRVWRASLIGAASLVSVDRARALIGYEPQYHVCPGGQL